MAESLLGKWNRQYEQRGDSAKLRRLRQQQAQVTMERDVLKKVLAIFSQPPKWSAATLRSLPFTNPWVHLTRCASYHEAKNDLIDYIRFYNHRRRH
ncbi:TPA: hypothetical protein ACRNQ3_005950 [Pseudomonas aeruginosa]|nr:hypothetical protein [Pseudomonas aeruginosa]HBO3334035.1 hypothetical protein [Pseudomonas aeruginosa]